MIDDEKYKGAQPRTIKHCCNQTAFMGIIVLPDVMNCIFTWQT